MHHSLGNGVTSLGSHPDFNAAQAAATAHHTKQRAMGKSLTNNNEEGENMFEEIFKSETCPHCGEDLYKAKKPKKRHTAQALGNELNPHKGSAAGVQTTPARAPTGPVVDRRASAKRGIVKSEEALFPISGGIRLAVYDNGEGDRALAADIESSTTGGAHGLFIPSARNLEMERKG